MRGDDKRETKTRKRIKQKVLIEAKSLREKVEFGGREPVRFCIDLRVLNLLSASVLELCSMEVELFVLIELSCSVDFALQCGKTWKRIFIGREFCNTFILIRDGGLCLSVKKYLQRTKSKLSFKPTV